MSIKILPGTPSETTIKRRSSTGYPKILEHRNDSIKCISHTYAVLPLIVDKEGGITGE